MALNRTTARARVRDLIGDPSTAEWADSKIDAAIDDALSQYSRWVPLIDKTTLAVVAGQDFYTLPDDTLTVLLTSYSEVGYSYNPQDPLSYPLIAVAGGGVSGYTMEPSVQGYAMDRFIREYERDVLERENSFGFTVIGNRLQLDPTPADSRTIYLLVAKLQNDTTFPKRDEFYFWRLAASYAAEALANKRGKFAAIRVGSESVQLRDPKWLLDQAKTWRSEFENYAGSLKLMSFQGN